MRCEFGCRNAIGMANLVGKERTPLAGVSGQYPLCEYHYLAVTEGSWDKVSLIQWEPLPGVETQHVTSNT